MFTETASRNNLSSLKQTIPEKRNHRPTATTAASTFSFPSPHGRGFYPSCLFADAPFPQKRGPLSLCVVKSIVSSDEADAGVFLPVFLHCLRNLTPRYAGDTWFLFQMRRLCFSFSLFCILSLSLCSLGNFVAGNGLRDQLLQLPSVMNLGSGGYFPRRCFRCGFLKLCTYVQ